MSIEPTLDVTVTDTVAFEFRVSNIGSEAIQFTFRSGQQADLVVYESDTDTEVWQWSADKMFTQAIATKTLRPGETLEYSFVWQCPPSGEYLVVATLTADIDASATATVVV